MSEEELKAVVDNATEEERSFLTAYLRIKREGGSGPLGVKLAEANRRMDAGQSVSLEELEAMIGAESAGRGLNYALDIDFEASEFIRSLKRGEAEQVARWIRHLKNLPFTTGTMTIPDETGREIQVSRSGRFFIYHWTDHAVKTVRVTAVEKID